MSESPIVGIDKNFEVHKNFKKIYKYKLKQGKKNFQPIVEKKKRNTKYGK